MSVGEWIALVAVAATILGASFGAYNALRNEIRDSRHKVVSDLSARFAKMGEELDEHGERIGRLETRVSVLEARRGG